MFYVVVGEYKETEGKRTTQQTVFMLYWWICYLICCGLFFSTYVFVLLLFLLFFVNTKQTMGKPTTNNKRKIQTQTPNKPSTTKRTKPSGNRNRRHWGIFGFGCFLGCCVCFLTFQPGRTKTPRGDHHLSARFPFVFSFRFFLLLFFELFLSKETKQTGKGPPPLVFYCFWLKKVSKQPQTLKDDEQPKIPQCLRFRFPEGFLFLSFCFRWCCFCFVWRFWGFWVWNLWFVGVCWFSVGFPCIHQKQKTHDINNKHFWKNKSTMHKRNTSQLSKNKHVFVCFSVPLVFFLFTNNKITHNTNYQLTDTQHNNSTTQHTHNIHTTNNKHTRPQNTTHTAHTHTHTHTHSVTVLCSGVRPKYRPGRVGVLLNSMLISCLVLYLDGLLVRSLGLFRPSRGRNCMHSYIGYDILTLAISIIVIIPIHRGSFPDGIVVMLRVPLRLRFVNGGVRLSGCVVSGL